VTARPGTGAVVLPGHGHGPGLPRFACPSSIRRCQSVAGMAMDRVIRVVGECMLEALQPADTRATAPPSRGRGGLPSLNMWDLAGVWRRTASHRIPIPAAPAHDAHTLRWFRADSTQQEDRHGRLPPSSSATPVLHAHAPPCSPLVWSFRRRSQPHPQLLRQPTSN
jgi:hypothetical protein